MSEKQRLFSRTERFETEPREGGPLCLEVHFMFDERVIARSCVPHHLVPHDGSTAEIHYPWPPEATSVRTRILYYKTDAGSIHSTAWRRTHAPMEHLELRHKPYKEPAKFVLELRGNVMTSGTPLDVQ